MGSRPWLALAACLLAFPGCGGTVRSGGNGTGGGGSESGGSGGAAGQAGRATGGTGGTKVCQSPLVRCGGTCVDTGSDANHCGACYSACTTGVACVNSTCQIDTGGSGGSCGAGLTYCSNFSRCLDVRTNPFACGSCYSGCPNSEECADGHCLPGTCFTGLTDCSAFGGFPDCADLSKNSSHCGACDVACGPYETCQDGRCIPPICSEPYVYCPTSGCTDVTTDITSCGSCGNGCIGDSTFDYSAYTCTNGKCSCAPLANKCGLGCSTQFWYCPPPDFSGSAADLCSQTARNAYEQCACKGCLAQITACAQSKACINAMDCSLNSVCVGCGGQIFSSCGDQQGNVDPLADALVACMNTDCATL